MKSNKKPTMKDIAERCGVSPMAVSKVLGGKGGISRKTAERIRAAAKDLNYRPNLVAKSLRVNATHSLGVVVSDNSHPLFAKLLKSVVDAAEASGYSIIMANTGQSRERERKAILSLLDKRIDGLLIASPLNVDAKSLKELRDLGIPSAFLMHAGGADIDSVVNDDFQGAYEMGGYLVRTGSRTVCMINLPVRSQSGRERLRGFKQALLEHGVVCRRDHVRHCRPGLEEGYAEMRKLLDGGLRHGAVFCGCDVIAIGAMRAIVESGLSIPGDIRLAGYDDIGFLEHIFVPLTTMRQPVREMGEKGVSLLLRRLREPERSVEMKVMPSQLIVRAST